MFDIYPGCAQLGRPPGQARMPTLHSPQNQRRVLASEGYAIRHREFDLQLSSRLRNVVEIALRVWLLDVDCRRENAVPHGEQGRRHSRRTARALGMADQALHARSRELVGMAIERELHGARLDAVV